MRTFTQKTSGLRRQCGDSLRAASARLKHPHRRGEEGFLLIEVMISALLVALIVTASFNGLDVATKLTVDQRHHDQAALIAAQSQEQLRSEPATALDVLVGNPHKYTRTVGGTVYTVSQEAKPVGSSGNAIACNVTETAAQTGGNFQVSSTVTWAQQQKAGRPAVKQAAVITPPTGSAVEVDVIDGNNGGVSGVTAKATFIPVESGSYNTVEGTTSAAGCVILAGIQSTHATIEIIEKTGYVTKTGALKVPPKELTIAPNLTTHYSVQYALGGRIAAHYTYAGASSWEGKEVLGDTFVAQINGPMGGLEPEYEVGSTSFEYEKTATENFKPLTGKYEATAYTAAGSKYPYGDLFPFKEEWITYAGDCEANKTGPEAEAKGGPVVGGTTVTKDVPLALTKLSIWTGNRKENKEAETAEALGPVKVTNTACASALKPPNAFATTFEHEQAKTAAAIGQPWGKLEDPFQPFGTFKLCVVSAKLKKTFTVPFTNAKASEPSTPWIYLGQKTSAEQTAAQKVLTEAETKLNTEETTAATAKTKRENEEKEALKAKEKREKEETEAKAAKTAREKKELEEREKWLAEEKAGKITKATREAKEKTQTTNREAAVKAENTAKAKREKEETEATAAKAKREKEETEAKAPREKRETEKAELTAKKTALTKEQGEENATGVTVESKLTC
jgi:Tfp pilus assembly protein PilV